jgi:hypothetical protein
LHKGFFSLLLYRIKVDKISKKWKGIAPLPFFTLLEPSAVAISLVDDFLTVDNLTAHRFAIGYALSLQLAVSVVESGGGFVDDTVEVVNEHFHSYCSFVI